MMKQLLLAAVVATALMALGPPTAFAVPDTPVIFDQHPGTAMAPDTPSAQLGAAIADMVVYHYAMTGKIPDGLPLSSTGAYIEAWASQSTAGDAGPPMIAVIDTSPHITSPVIILIGAKVDYGKPPFFMSFPQLTPVAAHVVITT
jgi:hypothetical protein